MGISVEYFGMQFGVDFYTVSFDELFPGFVISGRFDTLYFGEQFPYKRTHFLIIVDDDISFSVAFSQFEYFIICSFFQNPAGDELTVAHVRFFDVFPRCDAGKLGHQSVHHISVIFGFVCFCIGNKS